MLVISLVFAAALTPVGSLRLAQTESSIQINQQNKNIEKAKSDLKAKIDKIKNAKKSVIPGSRADEQLDKILERLNQYLEYLEYLTEDPSSVTDDKLFKIKKATDKILDFLDEILLVDSEIIFYSGDLFYAFDTVTQADIGLAYDPRKASIASGLIGSGGETSGGELDAGGTDEDADSDDSGSDNSGGVISGGGGGASPG
jgi:hypothetical protein